MRPKKKVANRIQGKSMAESLFPDTREIIGNNIGMMSGAAAAILQPEAPNM